MRKYISVSLFLVLLFVLEITSQAKTSAEAVAHKALSAEASESAAAVAELRTMGPEGLSVLFRVYADEIDRQLARPSITEHWQRLTEALDAVSQQKDSYLSGLYWYTDLSEAKRAAQLTGKPILSLRLLGKLSEPLSCANSRFFRTVLYSNADVSLLLREHFVLHWQSVRPAPRVTIDFGDGRKLEQTITGNSIHYVLDADGRPLDALPGLAGPAAFLRFLTRVEEVHGRVEKMDDAARIRALDDYHRASVRSITDHWLNDAQKAGGKIPEGLLARSKSNGKFRAVEIAPLAITKSGTELGILRAITRDTEALGSMTDEITWTRIALQHVLDAKLDNRSISLIRRQTQKLFATADGSGLSPDLKLRNLMQKLQLSIALDTVRNEYMLHTRLHAWLVADPSRFDLDMLNEKVYAELFLTPKSDPWLGLFSPDTYLALESGGITP